MVVFLFGTGYWLCKWKYPEAFLDNFNHNQIAVNNFTDLRYSIFAIIFGLMFIRTQIKGEMIRFEIFVLDTGIGLVISDLIDRFYFNITKFTKEDIIMIITTIFLSFLEVYTIFNLKNLKNYVLRNRKA